ncbi:MAG: flagellar biosynthetic protein FliO [Cellvibrio sp.]
MAVILNPVVTRKTVAGWFTALAMACLLLVSLPVNAEGETAAPVQGESLQESSAVSVSGIPAATDAPVVTEKKAAQGTRINSSTHLASVAAGLVLIVALILVLGWFLRRFNQGGLFNNSSIKIIATLPLGTRERLAVVDVGGQQLLLGITATQINTLHVFDEPVIAAGDSSSASSDFGKKLMAILQQKNNRDTAAPQDKSPV